MIDPISPTSIATPSTLEKTTSTKKPSIKQTSTITPKQPSSCFGTIFSSIWSVLRFIGSIFKAIFCCTCCYKKQSSANIEMPKGLLEDLAPEDPFRSLIQNPNGTLKNEEGYIATCELFSYFASTTPYKWALDHVSGTLGKKKEKVETADIHPLAFLYFLTMGKKQTSWVISFREKAISGVQVINKVLRWCGYPEEKPWEKFLGKQAKNFNKHAENIPSAIPGFCKKLKLDQKTVQEYVAKKDWKGLIQYVLNARQKEFNIS